MIPICIFVLSLITFQDTGINVPAELTEEAQTLLNRDLPDGWTLKTFAVDEIAPVEDGYKVRFGATVVLEESTYALYDSGDDATLLTLVAPAGEARRLYGTVLASERGGGWKVDLNLDITGLSVGETRDSFEGRTVVLGGEVTEYVAEREAQRQTAQRAALARLAENTEANAQALEARIARLETEAATFKEHVAAAVTAPPATVEEERAAPSVAAPNEGETLEAVAEGAEPTPVETSENMQGVATKPEGDGLSRLPHPRPVLNLCARCAGTTNE